ncbi:porin [Shimia sp. R9_1]|nr:porin [Shimia sp. R9_2]MBO9397994.1 porin [Shimia sp. R9_2]MBO9406953.1 porin [Shimia sp. R9_1]
MKKILFASTALVATASVAAADVTFGGAGRFGLVYDEGLADETILDHRIRVNITGLTETDGGVKFEGRIRLQAQEDDGFGSNGTGPGGVGFAVSTGGIRVDVGSVSDVFDSGDVLNWSGFEIGYTAISGQTSNFSGFDRNGFAGSGDDDNQTIKLRYTAGDFTGSASYSMETGSNGAGAGDAYWQIGGGYNFGAHNVGVMFGDSDADNQQWAIGVDGSFGDFGYSVLVADNDNMDDVAFGASGSYTISAATSVNAHISTGGNDANDTAYGVGVSHSLGGGVSLGAGVASNASGNTVGDLGVVFNF